MKALEMIKALSELVEKHGDLTIVGKEKGFGGYAMHLVDKPSSQPITIGTYDFEDEPDEETMKELFPGLEFDEDMPDIEVKCIQISFGSIIYST